MRFAICNELYEGWEFRATCEAVAGAGYTGLEVAPFTLAPLAQDVSPAKRTELRRQAEDAGVAVIGLHWLLAKTEGFHLNSADRDVRQRTANYLCELTRLCADLGGELMVFGSPAQRKVPAGASFEDALEYAADAFRQVAPTLAERGVKLCVEPLAPSETDFLQTAADAVRLIKMIDHPNVVLHLDVKAMSSEPTPIPELIHRHGSLLGHFHANDANLRGPGMGDVDFKPIFRALREIDYQGWTSVEVFDFKPDPETIARESIAYMRRCLAEA